MITVLKNDIVKAFIGAIVVLMLLVVYGITTPTMPDSRESVVLLTDGMGHGSGTIIDVNCVLTAKHCTGHPGLVVQTLDGDEYEIIKIVADSNSDLALIYIDGQFDERPLELCDVPLEIGDLVTVIGAPYEVGLIGTVLTGHVVNIDHEVVIPGYEPDVNMDILDTHAGPGCSGGPVLDSQGRVRGVFTLGQGMLGGAVPIEELDVGP